jgi:NtrC-family two-component system response regulator AlgB
MNSTLEGTKPVCLVVDDENSIRKTLCVTLEADGWIARDCASLDAAKLAMEEEFFDLALVDLRLGTQSGLDLLPLLHQSQPGLPVIMITAFASISSAVEAMRRGAVDYLPKPFTPTDVRRAAGQALAQRASQRRENDLESQVLLESRVPAVREVLTQARKVAESGSTALLLRGDTGTGKGVLARAVHTWSPRNAKPFVVVACPALPADLLESELFGHAQGAFTGAYRDHKGRVSQAEGGTLFLDEIGDLSLGLQVKLLRLLQEKEYERLGENETRQADVRIIAATHVDLKAAILDGRFREDLYYRLNVVELTLPPLRERLEDIEGLASNMLAELRRESGTGPLKLDTDTLDRFKAYSWPGNLREMRNVLERACVLGDGKDVTLKHLAPGFGQGFSMTDVDPETLASLDEVELSQIRKVLRASRTLEQAAKILGVDTATLWRKRKKHNL